MGKQDRYDFDTAEDDLGQDEGENEVDEDETATDPFEESTESVGAKTGTAPQDTTERRDEKPAIETESTNTSSELAPDEIPHRVRYDSPKTDRDQKMFYLGDEDGERLSELERLAETEFDENIHATDVRLAAFRSDLTDASFLNEMRAIGYGYFDS